MRSSAVKGLLSLAVCMTACYQGADCRIEYTSDCRLSSEITSIEFSPEPIAGEFVGNGSVVSCWFGDDPFDPGRGFGIRFVYKLSDNELVEECKTSPALSGGLCDGLLFALSVHANYVQGYSFKPPLLGETSGSITVGPLWRIGKPASSTEPPHFFLGDGEVTFTHLSERMNRAEFVLRYVPNPDYETDLKAYGMWRESIEVAGWCVCEPYHTGSFCVE